MESISFYRPGKEILQWLEIEEEYRKAPYLDSEGNLTWGTGWLVEHIFGIRRAFDLGLKDQMILPKCTSDAILTGYASFFADRMAEGLSRLLEKKIDLDQNDIPGWNTARRDCLISMHFQLSALWFLDDVAKGDWERVSRRVLFNIIPATREISDIPTKYSKQTSARAHRNSEVLRTGEYPKGFVS